jgi:hypothetical protein
MKQDYTMYIYKADRRTKTGERLFSTTVWRDRTAEAMRHECDGLYWLYPATKGWRFEYFPYNEDCTQLDERQRCTNSTRHTTLM